MLVPHGGRGALRPEGFRHGRAAPSAIHANRPRGTVRCSLPPRGEPQLDMALAGEYQEPAKDGLRADQAA
jgi:hypothetical protein